MHTYTHLFEAAERQNVSPRLTTRMVAVDLPCEGRKGRVEVVVGMTHLHAEEVDALERPPGFFRAQLEVHQRIQQGVIYVVPSPVNVDVPFLNGCEPVGDHHAHQNGDSKVVPGGHVLNMCGVLVSSHNI